MKADYKGKLSRLFREVHLLSITRYGYTIKELHAQLLEDGLSVSERTVYRDVMDHISESGITIVEQGNRYSNGKAPTFYRIAHSDLSDDSQEVKRLTEIIHSLEKDVQNLVRRNHKLKRALYMLGYKSGKTLKVQQ